MILASCSATRHVPEGKALLERVSITVEDSAGVPTKELYNYLRQTPNHKVLGMMRLQLGIYNMSGADTTKRLNRFIRKIGQAPVVYDQQLTDQSARQLKLALINRGYNDVTVEVDTIRVKRRRMAVNYRLKPGKPYVISNIAYEFEDPKMHTLVMRDSLRLGVTPGDLLNRDNLDAQRAMIAERLREQGYYAFTKDYITFTVDTLEGSKAVDLTMTLHTPAQGHQSYRFRNVYVVTDFNPGDDATNMSFEARDTTTYKGIRILYGTDRYLTPKAIDNQLYIRPGEQYSTSAVDRTYEALNRLAILRYVNIINQSAGTADDGEELLDSYVLLSRNKKQGVTFELEGTNSEGDLGVGGGITYTNRNLAHRGEVLTTKLRGSYESLSGDLDGLINHNYTEVAAEVGLTIPRFEAPFVSSSLKKRVRASTEFTATFMHQNRPEYTRIVAGLGWKYKWSNRTNTTRRTFDLLDINLVNIPRSSADFINHIAPHNPLLRYSYEDHFIMRMGYAWVHTNRTTTRGQTIKLAPRINTYTMRMAVETAGNLLYAFSTICGQKRSQGAYKIFNTQYAQYVKGEFDYSLSHLFSSRTSLAFHVGSGVGVPYGNSSMIPFEKRFYAGGANGVRGWGVRTLGPGAYDSRNNVIDFINQCGDISLLVNLEFRAKLFWVFEGALFVDAGNIWTIRNYPTQPRGVWRWNKFYKQIAGAYGIGLRMDFTYFLLRLDLGLKAHNPAHGQDPWPLIHPRWSRDATFHFSVGYPF